MTSGVRYAIKRYIGFRKEHLTLAKWICSDFAGYGNSQKGFKHGNNRTQLVFLFITLTVSRGWFGGRTDRNSGTNHKSNEKISGKR